jgi:mono/diheme cytochrome c family protein
MPRTENLRLLILLLVPGGATAQTAQSAFTPKDNSVYAELTKAPRKAAVRPNPLAADPEAVAAGAKLFDLHCAECHGEMAEGGKKAPTLLAPEIEQATPGTLFWLLTNGVVRRGMPVWSKLPEPQRWQLVSYIKSLTAVPPTAAEPQVSPESTSSPPRGPRPQKDSKKRVRTCPPGAGLQLSGRCDFPECPCIK